ncbi:unnamed protein product [Protopolystoma xenopodis]|uniref:Uncharacterized protein n=1 Tax=Protopolystoma xenopodis TaxID=117903 RepID=A0A448WHE3_9PLAT|nr:unnamed protein product [Protopolystoma xenopodis]
MVESLQQLPASLPRSLPSTSSLNTTYSSFPYCIPPHSPHLLPSSTPTHGRSLSPTLHSLVSSHPLHSQPSTLLSQLSAPSVNTYRVLAPSNHQSHSLSDQKSNLALELNNSRPGLRRRNSKSQTISNMGASSSIAATFGVAHRLEAVWHPIDWKARIFADEPNKGTLLLDLESVPGEIRQGWPRHDNAWPPGARVRRPSATRSAQEEARILLTGLLSGQPSSSINLSAMVTKHRNKLTSRLSDRVQRAGSLAAAKVAGAMASHWSRPDSHVSSSPIDATPVSLVIKNVASTLSEVQVPTECETQIPSAVASTSSKISNSAVQQQSENGRRRRQLSRSSCSSRRRRHTSYTSSRHGAELSLSGPLNDGKVAPSTGKGRIVNGDTDRRSSSCYGGGPAQRTKSNSSSSESDFDDHASWLEHTSVPNSDQLAMGQSRCRSSIRCSRQTARPTTTVTYLNKVQQPMPPPSYTLLPNQPINHAQLQPTSSLNARLGPFTENIYSSSKAMPISQPNLAFGYMPSRCSKQIRTNVVGNPSPKAIRTTTSSADPPSLGTRHINPINSISSQPGSFVTLPKASVRLRPKPPAPPIPTLYSPNATLQILSPSLDKNIDSNFCQPLSQNMGLNTSSRSGLVSRSDQSPCTLIHSPRLPASCLGSSEGLPSSSLVTSFPLSKPSAVGRLALRDDSSSDTLTEQQDLDWTSKCFMLIALITLSHHFSTTPLFILFYCRYHISVHSCLSYFTFIP